MRWIVRTFTYISLATLSMGCATSQSLVPDAAKQIGNAGDAFKKFVTCLWTNPTPTTLAQVNSGGVGRCVLPASLRDSLAGRAPAWCRGDGRLALTTAGMRENARLAAAVFDDPLQNQIDYWARQSFAVVPEATAIKTSTAQVTRYTQTVEASVRSDGWRFLAYEAALLEANLGLEITALQEASASGKAPCSPQRLNALFAEQRRLRYANRAILYVAEYLKAYFRGAAAIEVKVNLEKTFEKIKADIKARFPGLDKTEFAKIAEREIKEAFRKLFKKADLGKLDAHVKLAVDDKWTQATVKLGYMLSESEANAGFVTRGGEKHAFKTIAIDFEPTSGKVDIGDIDYEQIGADLIRVLLEALFDAWFQVPGDAGATGVKLKEQAMPKWECPNDVCDVSAKELKKVDEWAGRAEAAVGSAVSRIIRGLGPISLDNEALAVLVETVLAVTARKVTEKIAWCVFSVLPDFGVAAHATTLDEAQYEIQRAMAAAGGAGTSRVTVTRTELTISR